MAASIATAGVAEAGKHDTLMKKNGLYRKLVDCRRMRQIGNLVDCEFRLIMQPNLT